MPRRLAGAALFLSALLTAACSGSGGSGIRVGENADVSKAPGPQFETRIAIDPLNDRNLVAASMGQGRPSSLMLVYGSTDGGATWSGTPLPRIPGGCAWDPTVTVDGEGRQYLAYARMVDCRRRGAAAIFLATRAGSRSAWREPKTPVLPVRRYRFDDAPQLIADTVPGSRFRGRLYLAWSGYGVFPPIRVISSDDGGRAWSHPVDVSDSGTAIRPSLAVGRGGDLYIVWEEALTGEITLDRSLDGGRTFGADRIVASATLNEGGFCGNRIRAQGKHQNGDGCVRPVPTIAVDRAHARVYVTWSGPAADRSQDVFVAAYDARLRPIEAPRAVTGKGDQFMPASAVDQSSGTLWVCFYDTAGDRARVETRYSCLRSHDGKKWTKPARVASKASNERRRGAAFYGDYTGLAAAEGVAHPIWTDSRDLDRLAEEIYTASLR